MKKLLTSSFLSLSFLLTAQNTLILRSSVAGGGDAIIHSLNSSANLGSHKDFAAIAGSNGGVDVTVRSLVKFDFSSIPPGAVIIDAQLGFFGYNSSGNGTHSTLNGPNNTLLKRITSPWQESTVTWNTQPTSSTVNQVSLPATTSDYENITGINVKALVIDILNSGSNYGMMLELHTEQKYRKVIFASANHPDTTLHPLLIITYSDTTNTASSDSCFTIQPNSNQGKDAMIHSLQSTTNFGQGKDFAAIAGSNSGVNITTRSFLDFDLSGIPPGAIIDNARLTLYAYNSTGNGSHSRLGGSNKVKLERVTDQWNENTITWSNQPVSTSHNAVFLPASQMSLQNYPSQNITALIQDIVDSSSYGIVMKLDTEVKYRKLLFASSDHPDPSLHPKLEICYSVNGINLDENNLKELELYPNPASEILLIQNYTKQNLKNLMLFDATGKQINVQWDPNNGSIDISDIEPGFYHIIMITNHQKIVKKLIIEN